MGFLGDPFVCNGFLAAYCKSLKDLVSAPEFAAENDTLVNVLSACSNLENVKIEKWVTVLSEIGKNFNSKNSGCDAVNIVLIYLYRKWGKIEKSREIFDEIVQNDKRSVLPWNAMIGCICTKWLPYGGLEYFLPNSGGSHS
nr:putative pentatricopeptide repeat-containing protein [Quercus suber]